MRTLFTGSVLAVLLVFAGSVYGARCAGWPDTSNVRWCDDFDNYCTENNPINPWPGYPPTPDTVCSTSSTADSSFFQQSYHWPSLCGEEFVEMAVGTESWGADSLPFFAKYYGGGTTAQYHRWDLASSISARYPGMNAVNGTDANPLYLRFFFGDNLAGSPPNSPLYLELCMDDDRAPTDYVEMDCMDYHDCNCVSSNLSATCATGTCENYACEGTCDFHQCVNSVCADDGGPKAGQPCSRDAQCSLCEGGPRPGAGCIADYDCSGCNGGPNAGLKCNNDSECGGTCIDGPKTGLACSTNNDCGGCVGGATPGAACTTDHQCQTACGAEQQATCEGGPHDGTPCSLDSECSGGPIYPVVVQQFFNASIVPPHPPAPTTIHKSLAFGQLAQTDRNPCNLETGKKPTQYHACMFDGLKWQDLRANAYPGNGEDFNNDGRSAVYQMWVRTTHFDLQLDSFVGPDDNQTPQQSTATIPRQYFGPFNRIAMGTGPGCKVDPTTGECITGYSCWDYPIVWPASRVMWHNYGYDNVVLIDGELVSTVGACCLNDGSCEDLTEADCLAQDGHYQGAGTTCDTTTCCPYPFANVDDDDDVDQDDFGRFQICFTNVGGGVPPGCECFNRDGNSDIDGADFEAFSKCWSGPNVP